MEIGSWLSLRTAAGLVLTVVIAGHAVLPLGCHAEERHLTPEALANYGVQYLKHPKEPGARDSVFWAIGYPEATDSKRISRYVISKTGQGDVLLLFTSPFRLILYADSAPDIPRPFKIVRWSPDRCLDRLQEIRKSSHVELFGLDNTPECSSLTAFLIRDEDSFRDLARIWRIQREVANRVGGKYYPQALAAAGRGDFRTSFDLVTELVQCVIPEEPRLYVLVGAVGIAQGNQARIDFAVNALQWLDPVVAERLVSEAEAAKGSSEKERGAVAGRVLGILKDVRVTILPK